MSGRDLGISVTAIALTVIFAGLVALIGFFSLAFLDSCQPAYCSAGGAVTAVVITVLTLAAVGLAGVVITIVRLVQRKPAWPFAVGMFGLCMLTCVLGSTGYVMATGLTWS
ncbi:hypothetical protein H7J73_15060 [Mycolicibacterium komossense]|uniref:Uncharacterized protein n=1 Tax=Mycolicibacterium komossense TaxID=1779 RepID=A0ABT3CD69_9MYCO|nr:hypothetical protein [Mycolicibacterium komossense]